MSGNPLQNNQKLIIANCSGFFGDRFSDAQEMVEGGPIDVLTGDYLAELTMAILFRQTLKDPSLGYVSTFLKQMEQVMGQCLDKNIKVVSNAGGLNPKGLADKLEELSRTLGIHPRIAYIEGDNLLPRIQELQEKGEAFVHLDKGISLKESKGQPISANAYLGCWGIVDALKQGADIVVGGRLADAAMVMGPAAWKFNWKRTDWNNLAGAAVAGHIIECSAQATGGNYSFIEEVTSFQNVGFPIAEMHADGSCVITKHPGTGGLVSVGTVTAQLIYEIREPRYLTPDVVARFDTIDISQEGPDRVRISGVCGEPPTDTAKVCVNNLSGYRNSMTIVLTGLDIEKKAKIFEDALVESVGGRGEYEKFEVSLTRSDKNDPNTNEEAFAYLKVSVLDSNSRKVDKFSSRIVELALANIPGFTATAPPGKGTPSIMHWPALVSMSHITQKVYMDGKETVIDKTEIPIDRPLVAPQKVNIPGFPDSRMVKAPLGRAFATRSGDKGGNANLGVWAKSPEGYAFLKQFLTTEKLKELLTDMRTYEIERYEMPNLLAVNFYIRGVLGDGVAASFRTDPQAKTLGEYLRARIVEMPESILVR